MHQGLGSIALKGSLTLTVSTALLLLGAARSLSAQDVALTGGVIHTADGDVFEGGTVVVRDGKVTAVGNDVTVPRGVPVVDVSGRTIIPGRIMAIETQTTIACGGVQVNPGDIVGADDDGDIAPVHFLEYCC